MPNTMIVKQSDVRFGTALHFADDWSYGRNSLCGKPMRATAQDFELTYKRVCGSCKRIMAARVEKAHAEALAMAAPAAAPKLVHSVNLTPAMTTGLIHFHRTGNWDAVRTGTVCALLDRGLVTHSHRGVSPDVLTDWGVAAFVELGELRFVSEQCRHTVFVERCADCEHAVGAAPAGRPVPMTDRDRLIEQGKTLGLPASALLMDTEALRARVEVVTDAVAARKSADCPPVCEHGSTEDEGCPEVPCVSWEDNAFLLGTEYNFVIDCEQEFVNGLRNQGVSFSQAQKAVRTLRRGGTNVTLVWQLGDELLTEYDRLVRRHGDAIPFAVRDEAPQPVAATVCAGNC